MAIGNVVHVARSGFAREKSTCRARDGLHHGLGIDTVQLHVTVDRSGVGDAFLLSPRRGESLACLIPLRSRLWELD